MLHPLLAAVMALAVEVVGPSTCPAPADVGAALARLSAADSSGASVDGPAVVAEIGSSGDGVSIRLRAQDGALVADRVIARTGSCADLAAAAAVVIVAWQRGLRPDLGPDLPRSPPGTVVATTPGAVAVAAPQARSSWPFEIGVAALAAAAAGDVSPGLQVDATIGNLGWGFAPRVVGSIEWPHERALGPAPGRTLWSRGTLAAGVRKRSLVGSFAIDGQAQLKLALLRARGLGFDENYTRSGMDMGAGLGVQLAWPRGWFAPFLGLGATFWVGPKTAEVLGTSAETNLPRFEVSLALGVSLGRFP